MCVCPSCGQGIYNAELQKPEHSNAGIPALWELPALQFGHLLDLVLLILFFLALYRSTACHVFRRYRLSLYYNILYLIDF